MKTDKMASKPENRLFDLNEARALLKKLKTTTREDVSILETDGGVRLKLSTGMYELFRFSAERFQPNVFMNRTT